MTWPPAKGDAGLKALNDAEKRTVFECLRAASEGPFFPDWEFHTLFGLQRDQVTRIAAAAPNLDDSDEVVAGAINSSMQWLICYPHDQEALWSSYISVSDEEVDRVLDKWRGNVVI